MGVKSPALPAYPLMSNTPLSSDGLQGQLIPPSQTVPVTPPVPETLEIAVQGGPDTRMSLTSDGPAMDEAAKQEFLWHTHQYLGEYARYTDTKAAFAGAIATALLGALYTAKVHVPILRTSLDQWPFFAWLAAIGGVFLSASAILAVWTVFPRLRTTQSKGFIYWGNIAAHRNIDLLRTSFHSQSARTLNDHLLHHIFDISTNVCIPKYRAVSLCIVTLCLGGCLAAAALVLQDLSHKTITDPQSTAAASVSAPHR